MGSYTIALGKAAIRRAGADITAVAWGPSVEPLLQASKLIEEQEGIQVEVIDLRTIQPWDVECVEASVRKTGRLLVTHEVRAADLKWCFTSILAWVIDCDQACFACYPGSHHEWLRCRDCGKDHRPLLLQPGGSACAGVRPGYAVPPGL